MDQDLHSPAPASIRFRRLVRHWGLVFALAIGFLVMAMCVREKTDDRAGPEHWDGRDMALRTARRGTPRRRGPFRASVARADDPRLRPARRVRDPLRAHGDVPPEHASRIEASRISEGPGALDPGDRSPKKRPKPTRAQAGQGHAGHGADDRRRDGAPAKGSCPDRDKQIPGDPYSPPCIAFSGSNGGATTRGVTDKEIIVSARILDEKGFQQTLAALAGAEITDDPPDIKRTISAFAEYFNKHFQFYGRKIKIKLLRRQGLEHRRSCSAAARPKPRPTRSTSSQTIKAFAELNGATRSVRRRARASEGHRVRNAVPVAEVAPRITVRTTGASRPTARSSLRPPASTT